MPSPSRARGCRPGRSASSAWRFRRSNSDRVWAIVEAEDGGVFRSDDAGQTWTKINEDRNLRQRAWYYTRIYAGPKNIDEVYVVNVSSANRPTAARLFSAIAHAARRPSRSVDRSERSAAHDRRPTTAAPTSPSTAAPSWTTYHNQPTAQFYRVITDNAFPYRIYGAQQDNSTVRIRSRGDSAASPSAIGSRPPAARAAIIAVNPEDPDIVYGGSYGGYLERSQPSHATNMRNINVWPDNPLGAGAGDLKYRFQWNFPIFFSPHDPNTLYAAGNVLFKTTNEGSRWTPISPDLTRNDQVQARPVGRTDHQGQHRRSNTTARSSPPPNRRSKRACCGAAPTTAWCIVSRDGGKHWDQRHAARSARMEHDQQPRSPSHSRRAACISPRRSYKLDDFHPYLYKTTDYGKTWTKIVNGIKDDHFTRVVRADPKRPRSALRRHRAAACTSRSTTARTGSRFQLNLPIVPITDLAIKDNDLIAATQGRSFWVLDDLTPLHQLTPEIAKKTLHLFKPRPAFRMQGRVAAGSAPSRTDGQNPPAGTVLHFHLKAAPAKGTKSSLEIVDANGSVVREFKSDAAEPGAKFAVKAGMNRQVWNLRYADAEGFPGLILWGSLTGPQVVPGSLQGTSQSRQARGNRGVRCQAGPTSIGVAVRLRGATQIPVIRPRQTDGDASRHQDDPRRARSVEESRQAIEGSPR